jgi:hypothetical protein
VKVAEDSLLRDLHSPHLLLLIVVRGKNNSSFLHFRRDYYTAVLGQLSAPSLVRKKILNSEKDWSRDENCFFLLSNVDLNLKEIRLNSKI